MAKSPKKKLLGFCADFYFRQSSMTGSAALLLLLLLLLELEPDVDDVADLEISISYLYLFFHGDSERKREQNASSWTAPPKGGLGSKLWGRFSPLGTLQQCLKAQGRAK